MISEKRKFYSINMLKEMGYTHYKINKLVAAGNLNKINKKFYENLQYKGEESDFYYVFAFAPEGVICLLSAAMYYGLTTHRLEAVDVAIPRKGKISTLPVWPELNIRYFTDHRYETGILTVHEGENAFRVYDIEKTVVDIVYYREKVGIDETKEVLLNYLRRKDRNLNRLIRYARMLKCAYVMEKYLEVLL